MSLIVQKFGGTSVANTERLKNVADIVTKTAQAGNQVVVRIGRFVSRNAVERLQ